MKKKEIIIIIGILFVTVILILIPIITKNITSKTEEKESEDYINIKIEGEINYLADPFDETSITNNLNLTFPSGVSFGEINKVIYVYYTKYTNINLSFQTRYYKDTTITIPSSYQGGTKIEEDNQDESKININKATLQELKTLYGIGDRRAELIIEYRKTKQFENYEELKSLLGVSDEIIEIIKSASVL